MEYQKIINLLDNTQNESPKFRTKNWVERMMNHEACVMSVIRVNLKLQW